LFVLNIASSLGNIQSISEIENDHGTENYMQATSFIKKPIDEYLKIKSIFKPNFYIFTDFILKFIVKSYCLFIQFLIQMLMVICQQQKILW